MNRCAVVTASDSGIGKAVAVALARDGLDVGITWHTDERGAQETAQEVQALGRRAAVRHLDLEQLPEAAQVVDEHADELGGELWALVNNAGGGGGGPLLEMAYEEDYVAAKHGLGGLVKTAAIELAAGGITVNAVAPGEIATPLTGQEDVDPHTQARPDVPLRRPGDAREVAEVVAFLCSDRASCVTGSSYVVDGGMLQMGPMGGSHLDSDDWREG